MKKLILVVLATAFLSGCFSDEFELRKYYRDANSPAAQLMGSTYAGVVSTFNSLEKCEQMKWKVEKDDERIGYTNSRFECVLK